MARTNARYGWIPDLPDHRDFLFTAPHAVQATLSPTVDLRQNCRPSTIKASSAPAPETASPASCNSTQ